MEPGPRRRLLHRLRLQRPLHDQRGRRRSTRPLVYGTHVDAARRPARATARPARPTTGTSSRARRPAGARRIRAARPTRRPTRSTSARTRSRGSRSGCTTRRRALTGDVPEFDDEVVFSWDDYLDTNQAGNDLDVTAMPSTVEAHTYRVQVSTSDSFPSTSATDHIAGRLDQTSYTVSSKTLPEGPLFWRVQAIDARRQRAGVEPEQEPDRQRARDQEGLPRPVAGLPGQQRHLLGEPDLQVEPAQLRGEVQPRGLQEQRHDVVLGQPRGQRDRQPGVVRRVRQGAPAVLVVVPLARAAGGRVEPLRRLEPAAVVPDRR